MTEKNNHDWFKDKGGVHSLFNKHTSKSIPILTGLRVGVYSQVYFLFFLIFSIFIINSTIRSFGQVYFYYYSINSSFFNPI